jgi:hypothetical protein
MGILDSIRTPVSEAKDPLAEREKWLNMSQLFNSFTMNPEDSRGYYEGQERGIARQREAALLKSQQSASSDKLAKEAEQALRLIGIKHPDLTQAIQGGFMSGKEGVLEAMRRRNAPAELGTAAMQEYNFAKSQGHKGDFNEYILGQKSAGAPKTSVSYGGSSGAPAKAPDGMINMTNETTGLVTQVPIRGGVVDIGAQKQVTNANNALATIDSALNHSGLNASVGSIDSKFPSVTPDAVAFEAYHDQIKGKAFLAAFESLKGGGPITDVEGIKAEQATARLNLAQDEEDYKQALVDLKGVINDVLKRNQNVLGSIPENNNNDPLGLR